MSAEPAASGSAYMSPWRSSAASEAGLGELDPGEAEHFGRAVDSERALGARAPNSLDHPAGAGADVDQPADRAPSPERPARIAASTSLSAIWSERISSQSLGVGGEIKLGRGGPVGADGGEAGGVGGGPGILAVELGPALERGEQRLDPGRRRRG